MSAVTMKSQPPTQVQDRSTEVGEFRWNPESDTWWWSDALFRLLGYEPGAVAASLDRFLQHKAPDDRARVDAVFSRCLAEGGPFSCYHHVIDTQGRRKTVVAVGQGDRDAADTRTVAVQGFLVDVSGSSREATNTAVQASLASRAAIEQVKGVIRLIHGLDADAAFEMLAGHSQIANKKVAAIAADVLCGLDRRQPTETVTRAEVDRILREACLPTSG